MKLIYKAMVVALSLLFIWSMVAPVADVMYTVSHALTIYSSL